jgi:hypothetical protein
MRVESFFRGIYFLNLPNLVRNVIRKPLPEGRILKTQKGDIAITLCPPLNEDGTALTSFLTELEPIRK